MTINQLLFKKTKYDVLKYSFAFVRLNFINKMRFDLFHHKLYTILDYKSKLIINYPSLSETLVYHGGDLSCRANENVAAAP